MNPLRVRFRPRTLTLSSILMLLPTATAQSSWPPALQTGQVWTVSAAGETWTATAGAVDADGDRELQVSTPRGASKGWFILNSAKTVLSLLTLQGPDSYWACRLDQGSGPLYKGSLSFYAKRDGPAEARGTCTAQLRVAGVNPSSRWPYPLAAGQVWSVRTPSGTVTATLENNAGNWSGVVSRTPPVVMGVTAQTEDLSFMIVSSTSEQVCVIEQGGAGGAVLTGTAYDMNSEVALGGCSATLGPAAALAGVRAAVRPVWPVAPQTGDQWTITTPHGTWTSTVRPSEGIWMGRAAGPAAGDVGIQIGKTTVVAGVFADDGRVFACRVDQLGIGPASFTGTALYSPNGTATPTEAGTCTITQHR
ncbi:hypothetical protein GCM10010844_35630 [Deinococcus radiotolerans]|uniref:Uncharacterized protein n=2 Tax=Deinococcus radiotolerans TaxID=1309407 RepID=A0ABQ2FPC8_9DEIO|nr:hypothetical protein GCM10010844_35630 [Deinococcus radiotolerans]